MSSLVERLRVRSDRRPIYNLDESDDEADLVRGKSGMPEGNFEKIVRPDAVCFLFIYLFHSFNFNLINSHWVVYRFILHFVFLVRKL